MLIASILSLIFGCVTALLGAVYFFRSETIVRQTSDETRGAPKLLHFALPIRPRDSHITARQVRGTGLGLLLLSAWFLLVALLGIFFGHH